MNHFLLFFCCLLILASPATGAQFPLRPENHLLDDSNLLAESQKQELTAHWDRLEKSGLGDFHLISVAYLPQSLNAFFNHLRTQWPKENLGGIFVYSRGDSRWFFIASRQLAQELNPQELSAANEALASLKMQAVTGTGELAATLRRVTDSIAAKIEARNRGNRIFKSPNLILAGGLLAVGTMLFAFTRFRLKHQQRHQQGLAGHHYFPPVRVGYRLGGPFSGGTVVEAKFEVERK